MSVDQKPEGIEVGCNHTVSDDIMNLYHQLNEAEGAYHEIKAIELLDTIHQRWPLLKELNKRVESTASEKIRINRLNTLQY